MREVLLGTDPPVRLTERARTRLAVVRGEAVDTVHPAGTLITRERTGEHRWWTWAGLRTNLTLASSLAGVADPVQAGEGAYVRLREDLDPAMWRGALSGAAERLSLPEVNPKALRGLKFTEALPERLAVATLGARLADLDGAAAVLKEPVQFLR
jgi:ATP-dependent Lhr-like helicase